MTTKTRTPQDLAMVLTATDLTAETVSRALDDMDPAGRLVFLESLGRAEIVALFQRHARLPCAPADFLPTDGKPMQICEGINSLPMFRRFQKRFAPGAEGKPPVGYNHQAMAWLTGPGYFVVTPSKEKPEEALLDYTQAPGTAPSGWPEFRPNDGGISALVYGGMIDVMRRVSRDVFVGEAWKKGRPSGDYFVLLRTV